MGLSDVWRRRHSADGHGYGGGQSVPPDGMDERFATLEELVTPQESAAVILDRRSGRHRASRA